MSCFETQIEEEGFVFDPCGQDPTPEQQVNCEANGLPREVDDRLFHDVQGTYQFQGGTRITLAIDNLTDEDPPRVNLGFSANTDTPTYRLLGRNYWLLVDHRFQ